ncbi:hypothetical protein [Streptomyces sioyaensis]|uniref:hypothetical protein n=1 Tax=Streptomyces sioyaensis TaxID=67364 RepID=UPI0036E08F5B
MALLERHPDNAEIDTMLQRYEIKPDLVSSLPVIDPNQIDRADFVFHSWGTGASRGNHLGVVGRPNKMSYDYGCPVPMGDVVINLSPNPISRRMTGKKKFGAETSFSMSATVEAGFFKAVALSVSSAFSEAWQSDQVFSDSLDVMVCPRHMSWLEFTPVIRTVESDFVYFFALHHEAIYKARFSGSVNAPGLEGNLGNRLSIRDEPIPNDVAEALEASVPDLRNEASIRRDGETLTLPPAFASLLSAEGRASVKLKLPLDRGHLETGT